MYLCSIWSFLKMYQNEAYSIGKEKAGQKLAHWIRADSVEVLDTC